MPISWDWCSVSISWYKLVSFCIMPYNKVIYLPLFWIQKKISKNHLENFCNIMVDYLIVRHNTIGNGSRAPKLAEVCSPFYKWLYTTLCSYNIMKRCLLSWWYLEKAEAPAIICVKLNWLWLARSTGASFSARNPSKAGSSATISLEIPPTSATCKKDNAFSYFFGNGRLDYNKN